MSVSVKKNGVVSAGGNGINENLVADTLGISVNGWTQDGCTLTTENGSLKLVYTGGSKRIYHYVSNVWENNNIYTVSFWGKSDSGSCIVDFSRSVADFSDQITLSEDWEYYTCTITSTVDYTAGTLSIRLMSGTCYLKKIKLERGAIATPWIPNEADDTYISSSAFNESYSLASFGSDYITTNEFYEY